MCPKAVANEMYHGRRVAILCLMVRSVVKKTEHIHWQVFGQGNIKFWLLWHVQSSTETVHMRPWLKWIQDEFGIQMK